MSNGLANTECIKIPIIIRMSLMKNSSIDIQENL